MHAFIWLDHLYQAPECENSICLLLYGEAVCGMTLGGVLVKVSHAQWHFPLSIRIVGLLLEPDLSQDGIRELKG